MTVSPKLDTRSSGTGEDVFPEERLAADLFASSLILDNRMGGRRIRLLLEKGIIRNVRELLCQDAASFSEHLDALSATAEEKKAMSVLVCDEAKRDKARENAKTYFRCGIRSMNRDDREYPRAFGSLDGMPLVLYGIGDFSLVTSRRYPAVAVVGSRRPSPYGVAVTTEITRELSRRGVCIISGLARGIDTIAHEVTLSAAGKTIAVTAGGLDQIYPPENADLFHRICETGLVLSEMPPTQKVLRQYFPARNRILSALSDVVAIMEAGEFSGTLHTASFAAAQGRDVFAVPGGIYQSSYRGSLLLIQDGAEILISAEDILARLAGFAFFREIDEIRSAEDKRRLQLLKSKDPDAISDQEIKQLVIDQLTISDKSIDELSSEIGLAFQKIAPAISELELSGTVKGDHQRFTLTFPYT